MNKIILTLVLIILICVPAFAKQKLGRQWTHLTTDTTDAQWYYDLNSIKSDYEGFVAVLVKKANMNKKRNETYNYIFDCNMQTYTSRRALTSNLWGTCSELIQDNQVAGKLYEEVCKDHKRGKWLFGEMAK